MVALHKYKNKKIAIYGMGKTGLSVIKILKKLKIKFVCWDDDKEKLNGLTYNIDKFWIKKNYIDYIIISPGIDINKCKLKNYLKKNFNKIITDLDLFFELNKKTNIIAITGTNGKSTTCKILEKLLKTAKYKVQTVGNIGKPILSLNVIKNNFFIILEVSSYQLQYSKIFRSKYAAILNISPDHLDRHKNIKNYINIKSRIFFGQSSSDYSYVNATNKYSKSKVKLFKKKKLKSKLVLVKKKYAYIMSEKIRNKYFKSRSGIENLSFVYEVAKKLKINDKTIIRALNQFKNLPHRQQIIFENKKAICINDSKATSFDASLQSLLNYNKIYWIVGGKPKHLDEFNLKNVSQKIIKAYVVGKSTSFFVNKIKKNVKYLVAYNIKNALLQIYKDAQNVKEKNFTILFSPAAASYDQFNNFEERGNYFKDMAKKIFFKTHNAKF